MVYIVERLVLQTIYVLNKEILQFLGQNPRFINDRVSNQEQVIMARVRYLNFYLFCKFACADSFSCANNY